MSDDDRVVIACGNACRESPALVFRHGLVVRDEDVGRGIGLQKLPGEFLQHVVWNAVHRTAAKAEAALFHAAADHGEGLSRADHVIDQGVAGQDDAPNRVELVRQQLEVYDFAVDRDAAGQARHRLVGSVINGGDEPVEAVVVEFFELLGPFIVLPNPAFDAGLWRAGEKLADRSDF